MKSCFDCEFGKIIKTSSNFDNVDEFYFETCKKNFGNISIEELFILGDSELEKFPYICGFFKEKDENK